VLAAATAAHVAAAIAGLLYRRIVVDLWMFEISISNVSQMVLRAIVLFAMLAAVSSEVRGRFAAFMRSRGFFVAALAAAFWLSLGPVPQALGRPIDVAAPYRLLYDFVPGFEGLRVPARFVTIATLMLAALAGYGVAALARMTTSRLLPAVLAVAIMAESVAWPFPINRVAPLPDLATPDARVFRPGRAPAVYRDIARLPADAVIAELPLGSADYDLRAMFYSSVHWRRLINGYSGFFPSHYAQVEVAVSDVTRHPDAALDTLRALGATHVVVHERAYLAGQGERTTATLKEHGAVERSRADGDVLLELPPAAAAGAL
jgi:hypothetical protein